MDKEFFLPKIDEEALNEALAAEHPYVLMGALVEPLHEEMYRRQTFDFMEELTEGQQLILCFDYVMMQVKGGGFLQLLHNGYAGLLIDLPEQLKAIHAPEMALLIDEVLQFFVPRKEKIEQEMSVEAFAKLYEQMPEINELDERFVAIYQDALSKINQYVRHHLQEFMQMGG
jgi:hypothetical protein